jgi:hypothetical protein
MKPVMQSIEHDPSAGLIGDCFRACVASVLELELNEVPHFCESWDNWYALFQEWVTDRGLVAVEVKIDRPECLAATNGLMCILSGKTSESSVLHSVVGRYVHGVGFELLHDPHSRGEFFNGLEPDWVMFLLRVL